MEDINKVHLRGHLGGNPAVKVFENGKKMARFSFATKEKMKTYKGEDGIDVQWHYIVAWGEQATVVETQLKKGSFAEIEGRLVTRSYVDKNWVKRYHTEIVAHNILLIAEPKGNK